ncbi:unnamed protein product [Schistosoma curassoni]|uniref:Ovule protein n=1 Tax=Schistosoma curassoni TaxID=6186 RepID=A0A183K900_9TREM|nr:unnamed protein product [Schistosoma curassoni]
MNYIVFQKNPFSRQYSKSPIPPRKSDHIASITELRHGSSQDRTNASAKTVGTKISMIPLTLSPWRHKSFSTALPQVAKEAVIQMYGSLGLLEIRSI